jgi:hypothetical protein
MEARKSVLQAEITVQQGHNIKLLTLVNLFFLPLTFVTSVFGMEILPESKLLLTFCRHGRLTDSLQTSLFGDTPP